MGSAREGEEFTVSSGETFRIVGINENVDEDGLEELYERGINGMWVVERS